MNIDVGPKHSVCAAAGGAIAIVAAAAKPVTNKAALRFTSPPPSSSRQIAESSARAGAIPSPRGGKTGQGRAGAGLGAA